MEEDRDGGIDTRIGKNRRIESEPLKSGSSSAVTLDLPVSKRKKKLRSDFRVINFKPEGTYRDSAYYRPKKYIDIPFKVEACRTDEEDLDQLAIRYGPTFQILRNRPTRKKKAQNVFMHTGFPLTGDVQWSPLGSYLVSHHPNYAILSGCFGKRSPGLMRIPHPMLNLVDFSPGEKYLVTYNRPDSLTDPPKPSEFLIYDVETGRILMGGYECYGDVSWPVIRWAGGKDDSYFAMLSKNTISVYETENFNQLPEKLYDVVDMSWSPAESIIALLKGCGKKPAKVSFVKIPEMEELSGKDIDDVYEDYKMYWQSNGKYLAVILGPVLVLFRIKESGIPSEVLKVDKNILAFAWEPNGDRFAMIHGDQSVPLVSFYSMETPGKVSKLASFNKQADSLFWSPRGEHIVLAGMEVSQFEFFDVVKLETMNTVHHDMATVIAWDPTGRYVATAYTISQEMEEGFKKGFDWADHDPPFNPPNGFFMWSYKGEKLYWKSTAEEYRLLQLDWRPYGGSIDNEMLNNLKQESDGFSSDDECLNKRPIVVGEAEDSSGEEEDLASESEEDDLASE